MAEYNWTFPRTLIDSSSVGFSEVKPRPPLWSSIDDQINAVMRPNKIAEVSIHIVVMGVFVHVIGANEGQIETGRIVMPGTYLKIGKLELVFEMTVRYHWCMVNLTDMQWQ